MIFCFVDSVMSLPLNSISCSNAAHFWALCFLVESSFAFISNTIFVNSAWAILSPTPIDSGGDSNMGLVGVALVDFLGNNLLTSYLDVTFSFHFGSLGYGFLISFLVPFLTSVFMKKDVIVGFLASLSIGKGGNGYSSLSLFGPFPKLATF